VFLEFADEERAHFDLLVREYKALRARQGAQGSQVRKERRGARAIRPAR
jgi:hypothetical protein